MTLAFLVDDEESPWVPVTLDATERLSGTFRATVGLSAHLDGLDVADLPALLGKTVVLVVQRGEAQERRFSGVVTTCRTASSSEHLGEGVVSQIVDIVPTVAANDEHTRTRRFVGLAVPEIARAVLTNLEKAKGCLPAALKLQRPLLRLGEDVGPATPAAKDAYLPRESCTQYEESDWRFLRRILSEEGIAHFFEETAEGQRLVCVDDNKEAPVLSSTVSLVPVSHEVHEEESIHAARLVLRTAPSETEVHGFDFTRPLLPLRAARVHRKKSDEPTLGLIPGIGDHEANSPVTLAGFQHGAFSRDDAGVQLRIADERNLRDRRQLEGSGDVIAFSAGTRFIFDTGQVDPMAGEYLLVEVRHTAVNADAVIVGDPTSALPGGYQNFFTAIPADTPFRPDVLRRPEAFEDWAEIVSAEGTDPITPDSHGRVRVNFHDASERAQPSAWIPVLQRWAGEGFGFQVIPRAGMWARVTYLQGDPDKPLVTDCLPTGDTALPSPLPDEKSRLTLRTRSLRAGEAGVKHANELSFDDAAEREEVFERAGQDRHEVVLRDHAVEVKNHQAGVVGRDQQLTVRGDRRQVIRGGERQTLKANRKELVQADEVETILAKDESGGQEYLRTRSETIGKTATVAVTGTRTTDLIGHDKGTFDGGRDITVDEADDALNVNGSRTERADEEWVATHAKARISLKEGSSTMETEATAQLSTANGKVALAKDTLDTVFRSLTLSSGASVIKVEDERISLSAQKVVVRGKMATFRADPTGAKTTGTNITTSASTLSVLAGPMVSLKMTGGGGSPLVGLAERVEAVKVAAEKVETSLEKSVVKLSVTLRDGTGASLPSTEFRAFLPTGEVVTGTTDAAGTLVQELPEGLARFVVAFKERPDDRAPVLLEIGVPTGEKNEDALVHLRNQGYGAGSSAEEAPWLDFQMEHRQLSPSGLADDDTMAAIDKSLDEG